MNWGKLFVTATYLLEGDGPYLALECYEKIETVRLAIYTVHTPNLDAIARRLSDSADTSLLQRAFPPSHSKRSTASQTIQQCIVHYRTTCVQPGLNYFERHFNYGLKETLPAIKASRYFSPLRK